MLAEQVGPRERQRHDVLQLVAEAEGAARLVEAGPRPEPAAQVLVEEPAVHEQIEGVVRRAHLDGVQGIGPRTAAPRRRARSAAATLPWRRTSSRACVAIPSLSQEEDEAARLARRQGDRDLQRGAGIESGAECARQGRAAQRGRPRQRAVAAEERRAGRRSPSAAPRSRGRRRPGRRTPGCSGFVARIAPVSASMLGHHVQVLARPRRSQAPLVVGEHAQAPRPVGAVGEGQERELHRILRVHEDGEVLAGCRATRG